VEEEYFLLFTWREALFSFQQMTIDMTTVVDNAVTWSRDNGMENVFNAPAVALECLLMVRSKGASK